jgi:hypothetical protein
MTKDKKTPINNYPHGITFRLDDAAFTQLKRNTHLFRPPASEMTRYKPPPSL